MNPSGSHSLGSLRVGGFDGAANAAAGGEFTDDSC